MVPGPENEHFIEFWRFEVFYLESFYFFLPPRSRSEPTRPSFPEALSQKPSQWETRRGWAAFGRPPTHWEGFWGRLSGKGGREGFGEVGGWGGGRGVGMVPAPPGTQKNTPGPKTRNSNKIVKPCSWSRLVPGSHGVPRVPPQLPPAPGRPPKLQILGERGESGVKAERLPGGSGGSKSNSAASRPHRFSACAACRRPFSGGSNPALEAETRIHSDLELR